MRSNWQSISWRLGNRDSVTIHRGPALGEEEKQIMTNHEDTTITEQSQNTAGWIEAGRRLAQQHKRVQWAIADWLVSGAALYPDQRAVYDAAERLFPDYTRESLRHLATTARAFPACTRVHENLSFGHYRVAQSLPDGMMSDFLAKANSEHWSVTRLRLVIQDFQYQQRYPGSRAAAIPSSDMADAELDKDKVVLLPALEPITSV
jgi:hypothetical protein